MTHLRLNPSRQRAVQPRGWLLVAPLALALPSAAHAQDARATASDPSAPAATAAPAATGAASASLSAGGQQGYAAPGAQAQAQPAPTQQPPAPVVVVAPPEPAMVPRVVERGGGVGRVLAWTTLITGLGSGAAAGGLYLYSQQGVNDCRGSTGPFGGVCSMSREDQQVQQYALYAGVAGAGLLATSLLLFLVTEPHHTEVVYEPAPRRPAGASRVAVGAAADLDARAAAAVPPPPERPRTVLEQLPWGLYGAAALSLGGAIGAHVFASNARADLLVPERHPDRAATEERVNAARYGGAASVGLFALTGALAAWGTVSTVVTLNRHQASLRPSVALTPDAAHLTLSGRF